MNRPKALITGASSGIGKATAIRFANEGYDICANDIRSEELGALIKCLPEGNHLQLPGSYADENIIEKGKKLISDNWKHIDILVNCAGVFEKTDPVKMEMAEWKRIFDIMVNGSILISKLAINFMPDNGRIIHISSIHGTRAEVSASSYSMAKSAINQLCRSLALELAPKNILVNAIAPGFVNTGMSVVDGKNEIESDWFKQNYIEAHHLPLKRAARADEIAGVAFFLAGKDASYITGQVLTVDGGLSITF